MSKMDRVNKVCVLYCILLACICGRAHSQAVDVSFMTSYVEKAEERFHTMYPRLYTGKGELLESRYEPADLRLISVPILAFQERVYRCGDAIEPLVKVEEDALCQLVLITNDTNKRVATFTISDSFSDLVEAQTGLPLNPRPVFSDTNIAERRIVRYIEKNPDSFVFMIRLLEGYWVMKDGKIFKLKRTLLGWELLDGSLVLCQYGEELINDLIKHNDFRTGYYYPSCTGCSNPNDT